MEENKRKELNSGKEKDIFFSKVIKAGKRIYYLDVKKNRNGELFLAITESKRVNSTDQDSENGVIFEKHKVFLYKEDFDKFTNGITEVIGYIRAAQQETNSVEDESKKQISNTKTL